MGRSMYVIVFVAISHMPQCSISCQSFVRRVVGDMITNRRRHRQGKACESVCVIVIILVLNLLLSFCELQCMTIPAHSLNGGMDGGARGLPIHGCRSMPALNRTCFSGHLGTSHPVVR